MKKTMMRIVTVLAAVLAIFLMVSCKSIAHVPGTEKDKPNQKVNYVPRVKEEEIPVSEEVHLEQFDELEKEWDYLSLNPHSSEELINGVKKDNTISTTSRVDFHNSIMRYNYVPGKMYEVYLMPNFATDIRFDAGEEIIGYSIAQPEYFQIEWFDGVEGNNTYKHMIVKPLVSPALEGRTGGVGHTNAIFSTNKRTYYFKFIINMEAGFVGLRFAYNNEAKNMTSSSPNGSVSVAVDGSLIESATAYRSDPNKYNYAYQIVGTKDWIPSIAYDDSMNTFAVWESGFDSNTIAPAIYLKDGTDQAEIENVLPLTNGYMIPIVLSGSQEILMVQGKDTCTIFKR